MNKTNQSGGETKWFLFWTYSWCNFSVPIKKLFLFTLNITNFERRPIPADVKLDKADLKSCDLISLKRIIFTGNMWNDFLCNISKETNGSCTAVLLMPGSIFKSYKYLIFELFPLHSLYLEWSFSLEWSTYSDTFMINIDHIYSLKYEYVPSENDKEILTYWIISYKTKITLHYIDHTIIFIFFICRREVHNYWSTYPVHKLSIKCILQFYNKNWYKNIWYREFI